MTYSLGPRGGAELASTFQPPHSPMGWNTSIPINSLICNQHNISLVCYKPYIHFIDCFRGENCRKSAMGGYLHTEDTVTRAYSAVRDGVWDVHDMTPPQPWRHQASRSSRLYIHINLSSLLSSTVNAPYIHRYHIIPPSQNAKYTWYRVVGAAERGSRCKRGVRGLFLSLSAVFSFDMSMP